MAAEIVFSAAVGLILGILAAGFGIGLNILILFLIPVGIIFWLRKTVAVYILFAFIFCLAGNFYFFFYKNIRTAGFPETGSKGILSGVLITEPKLSGKYQTASMRLSAPYSGTMEIFMDPSRNLKYGDELEANGQVLAPLASSDLPSFAAYNLKIIGESKGFPLKAALLDIKNSSVGVLKKYLSPPASALMSGLIFGERGDFSDDFKNNMRLSGTTHLVALSGYNIGVLVYGIGLILGSYLSRKLRFFILLFAIFLFVIMVGGEASVVRAAIMGGLLLLSKEAGRIYSPRHAIAVSAAAMAAWNPLVLWELGFQFSFLSLLGLVYLSPAIQKIFKLKEPSPLAENFLVTTSAQLAVLPLIINYFGTFSVTAILANILILSFVPAIMSIGFFLVLAGWLFPFAAFVFGIFGEIFLRYMMFIISLFAKVRLPFGDFLKNIYFSIAYYLGLSYLIYASVKKRNPEPALISEDAR